MIDKNFQVTLLRIGDKSLASAVRLFLLRERFLTLAAANIDTTTSSQLRIILTTVTYCQCNLPKSPYRGMYHETKERNIGFVIRFALNVTIQ